MAADQLTDRIVANLPVPAKGIARTPDYGPETVRGLNVEVRASGSRVWTLRYRFGGTERFYTFADYPGTSVKAARTRARDLRQQIRDGVDPKAERDAKRDAPTVAELCDRYLTEHVKIHNKPRTQAVVSGIVENIIKPKLGKLKVAAVEHEDIARLHRELRATPRQANLTVAVLSKMFNLAEVWRDGSGAKLRPGNSNPCRHLRRYPENARDRYPLPEELARIGAVMREQIDAGKLRPEVAAPIRFLALVGCRLSEALALDLGDVDLKTGAWHLPDAKAGKRTSMLGAPALALLASLERTSGRAFPVSASTVEKAWSGEKRHEGSRKKPRPGIRDLAKCPDLRIHDLRHGVGTYAGAAGLNAFIVRDLLGQKTMAMTGRYVSRHTDPLRAAAHAVSRQIAAAMAGEGAEVVELHKQRSK